MTPNGPKKLFSCVCKADTHKKKSEKWSNILGLEGVKSTDIETVTSRDDVAVQVLKFLEATSNELTKYVPIQIELKEYDLKLEYVTVYSGKEDYAIGVVVHDKKDHSNALVTLDYLTKKEYKEFRNHDETSFIKPERLPEEKVTKKIVKKGIKVTQNKVVNPEVTGVLRWQESPNAEKDIVILKDENSESWIVVLITNIVEGTTLVEPILEEVTIADPKAINIILEKAEKKGPSEEVEKDANEVESVTCGVIHEG